MPEQSFEFFDPAEDCSWKSPRDIFIRQGYMPIPPGELNEHQLPGRLWELLYAAAARRFFFHSTNHLSNREFYELLWNRWLDEPTADIPPEAETNTNWIVSEFSVRGMTSEEIWLRYYADEDDRTAWESDEMIPAHEEPPFDRDRFLPTAPIPLEAHSAWLPGDDVEENSENDPLGLAQLDHEISASKTESLPEAVVNDLTASEPNNWVAPIKKLAEQNVPLLPPAEITEETLAPILWELLHNLALRGFYILHTDHLSDRELYSQLWGRGLRDPAHLPGRNPRGGWFHDFLGSWGEEEMQLWLSLYATPEERAKHAKEWPKETLPEKKPLPFKRDWRLPKGPF